MSKLDSQRKAGDVAKKIHSFCAGFINTGVNLLDIDRQIDKIITNHQMSASFKGFKGYPTATCLSVNDVVVHGIPYNYTLKDGDVISVDFGVTCDGWIVDTARTYAVGNVNPKIHKLIDCADLALLEAIKNCKIGKQIGDIGQAIENIVQKDGFYVVRDLTGHGVGKTLQEPPQIPNFGRAGRGQELKEGMSLAIEPIITLNKTKIYLADDNWSVITEPATIATHSEDTIYITKEGPINLTR